MNDPIQIIPLLSVFADDGEFTLRVDGSELAKLLTPQITSAIGQVSKARKLTLLTPTDTKIFKFTPPQNGSTPNAAPAENPPPERTPDPPPPIKARDRVIQDQSAPPAPEVASEAINEYEMQLIEQQKAEREMREAQRENSKTVEFPAPAEEEPAPSARKRVAKERPQPTSVTACGRCQGRGSIGGGGACPVCRGQGAISHFGRGRR